MIEIIDTGLLGVILATVIYLVKKTTCLLYTSDAADEEDSVDLGGRRIIKKKRVVNFFRTEFGL